MKYIMLLTILILTSGCDKKYCYDCTTMRTHHLAGDPDTYDTTSHVLCEQTEESIKAEMGMKAESHQWGHRTKTIISLTSCKKQQ